MGIIDNLIAASNAPSMKAATATSAPQSAPYVPTFTNPTNPLWQQQLTAAQAMINKPINAPQPGFMGRPFPQMPPNMQPGQSMMGGSAMGMPQVMPQHPMNMGGQPLTLAQQMLNARGGY